LPLTGGRWVASWLVDPERGIARASSPGQVAESLGRLAGEWLAKIEIPPDRSQDTLGPSETGAAETSATISVQRPIDSAGVPEAGSQPE
jgi:hypothetical protein